MTKRTSDLSIPIPKAIVATITWNRGFKKNIQTVESLYDGLKIWSERLYKTDRLSLLNILNFLYAEPNYLVSLASSRIKMKKFIVLLPEDYHCSISGEYWIWVWHQDQNGNNDWLYLVLINHVLHLHNLSLRSNIRYLTTKIK